MFRWLAGSALRYTLAVTVVIALLASASEAQRSGRTAVPLDSAGRVAALRDSVDRFVAIWRHAWEVSEHHRNIAADNYGVPTTVTLVGTATGAPAVIASLWPPPDGFDALTLSREESLSVNARHRGAIGPPIVSRNSLVHCHVEYVAVAQFVIPSGFGRHAICPSWYSQGIPLPWDERKDGIDAALLELLRPRVRAYRDTLLMLLVQSQRENPADGWIAGQLVRFALDNGDIDAAQESVSRCGGEPWWCTALRAYVSHIRGDAHESDRLYADAVSAMPAHVRCEWSDLSLLFSEDGKREYLRVPCARRDSLNAVIWWLSDRRYGDGVNERRAEHFARVTLAALRSGSRVHERWDMLAENGGDAVREMLTRYGWPGVAIWGGRATDRSHAGYLSTAPGVSRYATAEYSWNRFHLVPAFDAVRAPLESGDFHWTVSAAAHRAVYSGVDLWWPAEHIPLGNPVVQIWSQHGIFRRQDSAFVALAAALPIYDFPGMAPGDTLQGSLFLSTSEADARVIPRSGRIGRTNLITASLGSGAQLLSLELGDALLARTRFGVQAPEPLSALAPGEIAIVPPVFIQPLTPEELPPNRPDAALERMFSSVALRNQQVIGLYWETYGFSETDSAVLSLQIVRHDESRPGLLRRLGQALGLARNESRSGVTVQWEESQPRRTMMVATDGVPIQGRVMTLSVAQLVPGDYTLTMTASRPGGTPVSATRRFWIPY